MSRIQPGFVVQAAGLAVAGALALLGADPTLVLAARAYLVGWCALIIAKGSWTLIAGFARRRRVLLSLRTPRDLGDGRH